MFSKDKIVFVLFVLQMTVVYKTIQEYAPTGRVFKIAVLDNNIPFLPIFVIPYFLFAVVLFLPFVLAIKDRKKFWSLSITFFVTATVCNLIYILFQTTAIRPEILASSIFDKLILCIYNIDRPVNLFPSGHVTFSVLSNLCLIKINRKAALVFIPITMLIILSTLFIKQHYTPDVIAGIILALLSYQLVFKKILVQKIS